MTAHDLHICNPVMSLLSHHPVSHSRPQASAECILAGVTPEWDVWTYSVLQYATGVSKHFHTAPSIQVIAKLVFSGGVKAVS